MKLNNPFDRLNKHENIPISLFPADKTHSTSMRIGRLTPLYVCEMMQSNRIKLDVDQLTRFSALQVPVMNNYKVTYGAFFVPYHSFDGFFNSEWFKKFMGNSNNAKNKAKYILDARHFFNPASDDANRVFPAQAQLRIMNGNKLESSILDHLGYYIGTGAEDAKMQLAPLAITNWQSGDFTYGSNINIDTVGVVNRNAHCYHYNPATGQSVLSTASDFIGKSNNEVMIVPADYYIASVFATKSAVEGWFAVDEFGPSVYGGSDVFKTAIMVVDRDIFGENIPGLPSWSDVFGKVTISACLDAYLSYVKNLFILDLKGDFTANCIRYLAYMRIYADWFLNENFTKHDDFLDMIGCAYLNQAFNINKPSPLQLSFGDLYSANSNMDSTQGNYRLYQTPSLNFFRPYLQRGELLPVLWEKDRFTDARYQKVMAELGETPVGATVEQNFFNRQLAKFKDLITRMGYDYRDNTAALYGSKVPDSTLQRSQVVGFREFSVTIGDVAQTSSNTPDSQLGQFAGVGVSRDNTGGWDWTAEENGLFMVLAWIRPAHVCNACAVPRDILKSNYYDYLIPTLGGVGYQDIFLDEYSPDVNQRDQRFGYEEKYREYMSVNNEVHGNMRTSNKMYRSDRFPHTPFSISPSTIKELYITDDDEVNKVFQDSNPDYDPIIATMRFTGTVTRQLPSTIRTDF